MILEKIALGTEAITITSNSELTPSHSPADEMKRTVLATGLNVSAILAPSMAAFYLAQRLNWASGILPIVPYALFTLIFPVIWLLRKRLPFGLTANLFLAALLGLGFMLQLRGGLNFSTASIQLWILLFSGLVFGARAVLFTTAISLIGFILAGTAILNQWVPPIETSFWNQSDPYVWVRSGILLAMFGITSATAVASTITRLERQSQQLKASLDREIQQRRELEEAEKEKTRVREALAEAQRVEALGRLASGIAHDFNNSLTVITNSAEIALFQIDNPEKLQHSLNLIKRTALEAAKMTNSLLAIGRKDPSQKTIVSLKSTIESLSENLLRLLPADIRLNISALPAGNILIDRSQLERAILNLVVNAKDAIKQGGVIEIGCDIANPTNLGASDNKQYSMVYVKDNGCGMSSEVKNRMFEPFFTTKKSGSGIGLGMALLQSLVNDSLGQIDIKSELGVGTKISIYFPQSAIDQQPDSISTHTLIDHQNPSSCVFLVEDNPDVLSTSSEALTLNNYTVITAKDGHEALQIATDLTQKFELMCIDGVIPGVSSGEVIKQIKKIRPEVKIVVCSGYIEEELIVRGIDSGELAYIRKPYTAETLLKVIHQQISKTN